MSKSTTEQYKKEMDYCKANGYETQTLDKWLQERKKLNDLVQQIKQMEKR